MPHQELDLARMAAYIDGEGCIAISSTKAKTQACRMQIMIGNTDPRLSQWIIATFGGDVRLTGQGRKKKFWYWYMSGRKAADLLTECLPYFIMKRDQAEVAIAFQGLVITSRRYRKRDGNLKGGQIKQLTPEILEKRKALMYELHEVRQKSTFLVEEKVS
jgi:hypothetical protein